jgi:hypothetical protein
MSWSIENAPMLIRSLSRAAAFLAEIVLKNNQCPVTRYFKLEKAHLHSHDVSFGFAEEVLGCLESKTLICQMDKTVGYFRLEINQPSLA